MNPADTESGSVTHLKLKVDFIYTTKSPPVLPQCSDLGVNIMLGVFKLMKKNAL